MLFKPDFPRMKKFRYKGNEEFYGLEKIHKDRERLEEMGKKYCRRGKALRSTPFDDYRIVEKQNHYALYLL